MIQSFEAPPAPKENQFFSAANLSLNNNRDEHLSDQKEVSF